MVILCATATIRYHVDTLLMTWQFHVAYIIVFALSVVEAFPFCIEVLGLVCHVEGIQCTVRDNYCAVQVANW